LHDFSPFTFTDNVPSLVLLMHSLNYNALFVQNFIKYECFFA